MKKVCFIFLISSFIFILTNCVIQEYKPPENFFVLHNKTQAEIEAIYGKPVSVEKIEYSQNYSFAYKVSDEAVLKVEYFNGKADSFDYFIPATRQSKDPQKTLKLCNLDLKVEDAKQNTEGLHWIEESGDKWKWYVHIFKVNDMDFISCKAKFF